MSFIRLAALWVPAVCTPSAWALELVADRVDARRSTRSLDARRFPSLPRSMFGVGLRLRSFPTLESRPISDRLKGENHDA